MVILEYDYFPRKRKKHMINMSYILFIYKRSNDQKNSFHEKCIFILFDSSIIGWCFQCRILSATDIEVL